jgi:hypothetical protein
MGVAAAGHAVRTMPKRLTWVRQQHAAGWTIVHAHSWRRLSPRRPTVILQR